METIGNSVTPFEPEKTKSIFQEEWWLEASGGSELRKVEVFWGDKEVASLFYVQQRRFGLTLLRMPPYTRTLGPTFTLPVKNASERVKNIRRATKELVDKLPKHAWFRQVLDPNDESAFAFALCDLTISTEYTCRIAPDTDLVRFRAEMDKVRRKRIEQREKDLVVTNHNDMDRFEKLAKREYSEKTNLYDFKTLARLFESAKARGQAIIISAADEHLKDVCSAILVWDTKVLYFWVATRDHDGAGRGAKSLLTWHAIKFAQARGLSFDFDSYGSVIGARYMASFGSIPLVRSIVTRETLPVKVALAFRREPT
jgi:hypothetical protein